MNHLSLFYNMLYATECLLRRGMGDTLSEERIIALGLLTKRDVEVLGSGFTRVWQIQETPCFSQLLRAIDEADRELVRDADARAAEEACDKK